MEKPLSAAELRALEKKLQDLQESLSEQITSLEENSLEPPGSTRLTREDEALEETSVDEGITVLSTEGELKSAVDDALDRIADGTYGICSSCGAVISRQRLDVLPYADSCSRCAAREQSSA